MDTIQVWTVRIDIPAGNQHSSHLHTVRWLTPSGDVGGFNQMAALADEDLAQRFMAACTPRLAVARPGNIKLHILSWMTLSDPTVLRLMEAHSARARQRLDQGLSSRQAKFCPPRNLGMTRAIQSGL